MSQPQAYGAGMMYTPQIFNPQVVTLSPGIQSDWENEFNKLSELTTKEKGKGRLVEVDDEGRALDSLEEAFKTASLQQDGGQEDENGNVEDYMKSFEKCGTRVILTESNSH